MPWVEILTALALVLIIEGILPFMSPAQYRRMVLEIAQLKDGQIRNIGLAVMIAGLILLYLVRN